LTIMLDQESMAEVGARYDSLVSVGVKGVTVISDDRIQVLTPQKAKGRMVVRTYSISDLSGSACGLVTHEQAASFINLIQSTIESGSWKESGGEGTISFDPVRRALIIKQSAEFHGALCGGLR